MCQIHNTLYRLNYFSQYNRFHLSTGCSFIHRPVRYLSSLNTGAYTIQDNVNRQSRMFHYLDCMDTIQSLTTPLFIHFKSNFLQCQILYPRRKYIHHYHVTQRYASTSVTTTTNSNETVSSYVDLKHSSNQLNKSKTDTSLHLTEDVQSDIIQTDPITSLPHQLNEISPTIVEATLKDDIVYARVDQSIEIKLQPLLVVIDLDETLFFSHLNRDSAHDFSVQIDKQEIFVSVRPGALEFLNWCQQHFDTGLYTAGTESYAKALLNIIDPEQQLISLKNQRYRQSCWPVQYEIHFNNTSVRQTLYTKDLSLFRNDLSRIVLVDNSLFSFILQPDNGIPISDWRGTIKHHQVLPVGDPGNEAASPQQSSELGQTHTTDIHHEDVLTSSSDSTTSEHIDFNHHQILDSNEDSLNNDNQSQSLYSHIHPQDLFNKNKLPFQPLLSTNNDNVPMTDIKEHEMLRYKDFYSIKQTLEELKDVDDVKPVLRKKFRLVDEIVRRCMNGMMISKP